MACRRRRPAPRPSRSNPTTRCIAFVTCGLWPISGGTQAGNAFADYEFNTSAHADHATLEFKLNENSISFDGGTQSGLADVQLIATVNIDYTAASGQNRTAPHPRVIPAAASALMSASWTDPSSSVNRSSATGGSARARTSKVAA